MMKQLRWFAFSVLGLILTGFILFSGAFAWVQTDSGKATLQNWMIRSAAAHNIELTMDSIKGHLPFHWKVSNIAIKTPGGTRVAILKAKGNLSFFALLRGEIFFNSLKLQEVMVDPLGDAPSPTFSVYGKGKYGFRRPFLGVNVRAYLDEDPETTFALDALFEKSGYIKGNLSLSTPSTQVVAKNIELPLHGPASFEADFSGTVKQLNVHTFQAYTPLFAFKGELLVTDLKAIERAEATFNLVYPFPIEGKVDLKDGHLNMTSTADALTIGEQPFTSAHLALNLKQSGFTWSGVLHGGAASDSLPLNLNSGILFDPSGELTLSDLTLLAPEAQIGGALTVHFPKFSVDGSLIAQARDLSHFRRLSPKWRFNGGLGGEVTFVSSPTQSGTAHLVLDRFQLGEIQARRTTLKVASEDLFVEPSGTLALEMQDFTFRDLIISSGSVGLKLEEGALPFEVKATGTWNSPLSLNLRGSVTPFTEERKGSVESFDAHALGQEFHLEKPFSLRWTPEEFDLTEISMTFSEGWLRASADLKPAASLIEVKSSHFPLELLSRLSPTLSMNGGAAIDLELQSEGDEITGHLNLLLEQVRLFQFGKSSPLMAKGSLSANINKETLQVHSHLLASGHQFFTASASLPIVFTPAPWRLRIAPKKPFSAQLFLDGQIEEIFDFLNLGSQEIKGHVMGQIFLSNTPASPHLKGGLKLLDGGYENFTIGTSVQEIKVELTAENELLKLTTATGKGPKGGTVTGTGYFKVSPLEHFPYHFETQAVDITGVDFDMISARATGPIFFDGTLKELLIHGKVGIASADFKIPDSLPVDIPNYPVKLINPPPHLKITPPSKTRFPVSYDFKVKADEHVKVHGRGLTSEWKGKAHINGTGGDFKGEGSLSLIRGEFDFSGKRFSLTKGEINFSENGAFIDLRGNLQLADVTIVAVLSGSLTAPSLTFQSNPSMPTSDILARLIFDKDMSEITPFQAIQLAQMIVTLSGDSGPNVLEKIRTSLGVDRFNIVSGGTTGEEISVQIGKYLTQGVMITLSQSAHSSQVIVEVELKGGFIFQAETQEEEEGKFSLKWNHNY